MALNFTTIQNHPNNFLFCYKSEITSKKVITTSSLRFSPLGSLNDPIENTLLTFFLDTDERFLMEDLESYYSLLRENLKKYCDNYIKVLCFTMSNELDSKTFISQSHMGYMRFSMWSHYADSGKGLCFIFDKDKLDDEFSKLLHKENLFGKKGEVTYTEDYVHNTAFRFMHHEIMSLKAGINILKPKIQKFYKEYFFKKRNDWASESEYRYLLISDRIENIDISSSLAGIVFGYKCSSDLVNKVIYTPALSRIPKAQIKLQGFHAYIEGIG